MIEFLHPTQVNDGLKMALEDYLTYLRMRTPGASIEITSDWNPPGEGGHVQESQHYQGLAADFHVHGVSLLDAWLALERFPKIMGVGIYPYWATPGLHADIRPTATRARWWRDAKQNYLGVDRNLVNLLI